VQYAHHPIHATREEVAHAYRVVLEGESPATFAIVVGVLIAFLLPFAGLIMSLAFVIAHFA
jgi:hypothetical protein